MPQCVSFLSFPIYSQLKQERRVWPVSSGTIIPSSVTNYTWCQVKIVPQIAVECDVTVRNIQKTYFLFQ